MLPTILSLVLLAPTCQSQPIRVRLTVASDAWRSSIATIRESVERTWMPAGLRVVWVEQSANTWTGVDFWIAALHDMRSDGRQVIGSVSFVGDRPQPLARLSIDHAVDLARRHQANLLHTTVRVLESGAVDDTLLVARVLGYAAAHELGHFVLTTKRHSADGIMQAGYPRLDQLENDSLWALDDGNRTKLRTKLQSCLIAANER